MNLTQDEQKILVATTAVDTLVKEGKIFSGMKIGLGTGSTAMPAVKRIGELVKDGTLKDIKAVATSFQTTVACQELGIPVFSMNDPAISGVLDLAIDGADEVGPENTLIKGGGAALLREKIVEYNSKIFVVIADSSKAVPHHGTAFPLPVEVIGEARTSVTLALKEWGAACTLRQGIKKAGPVITDNGNMILDCLWKSPADPALMEEKINSIAGVVECGFFTRNRPQVFISFPDGTVERRV